MRNTTHLEPCFLCQSPARWEEISRAARRHYLCSSAACGEYEVSLAAMQRVESNEEFKRTASLIAAGVGDPGKILAIELAADSAKDLEVRVVPRKNG